MNNMLFYNCNLTKCNFENTTFNNVIFINCKLHNDNNNKIENLKLEAKTISSDLKKACINLKTNKKLEKYNILITKTNKINILLLYYLLAKWDDLSLMHAFKKLESDTKKQYFSFFSYVNDIANYSKE